MQAPETEKEAPPDWPTCHEKGCIGIQLAGQDRCLAHVALVDREAFLAALKPGADLDLRGTPIDAPLLADVLTAVKQDGRPTLGDARFERVRFSGGANFFRTQFRGVANFFRAQFSGGARFEEAEFSVARRLGPFSVDPDLSLRDSSFLAPILIEVTTSRLSLVGATFQEGVTLRVQGVLFDVWVTLDGASFPKPSSISGAESSKVSVLSVRLVDVSNLVLGDVALSDCLFQGARNLERLRIEGPLRFGWEADRESHLAWRLMRLLLRLRFGIWEQISSGRQMLAEERWWRARARGTAIGVAALMDDRVERIPGERTRGLEVVPTESQNLELKFKWVVERSGQKVVVLRPEHLAALYRALRKGLEDQKNAPAAADFYYGEMEMRRHSGTTSWTDRLVLWVYWLFSGYGLRASRALLAFVFLVPLFAIGFWRWGSLDAPSYPTALLRSFESATSLLRPAPQGLNELGQVLDAFLRLIGATLLGLAVFSLRGRIKR